MNFKRFKKKYFLVLLLLILAALAIGYSLFVKNSAIPTIIKNDNPSLPSGSAQSPTATLSDFYLQIPKLSISAPIIANVDGNNKTAYFKALQSGVAHFKGTSKPGGGSNIFIFGHSSFYASDPGQFKTIFSRLNELKNGDEIIVGYKSKKYCYIVFDSKEVEPTDVSVLTPTSYEQLTLMTCWPLGSTSKRLIVLAKPQ